MSTPNFSDVAKWADTLTKAAAKTADRSAVGPSASAFSTLIQNAAPKLEQVAAGPVGGVAEKFVRANPISQMVAISGGMQVAAGVAALATAGRKSRDVGTGKINKAAMRTICMRAVGSVAIGGLITGLSLGLGRGALSKLTSGGAGQGRG